MPDPRTAIVTIDSLAGGGDGVGRVDGETLFVPGVAPGDEVRVRLPPRRKSWCRATAVELLRAGPQRYPPSCPVYERCGGCQWLQVRYRAQLAAKEQLLARAFRQARISAPIPPFIPAPRPLHYRCRARLHWRLSTGAPVRLGFMGHRTHEIVNTDHCPILLPELSALLPTLREAGLPPTRHAEALLLGNEHGDRALAIQHLDDPRAATRLADALRDVVQGVIIRAAPPPQHRQPTVRGHLEIDLSIADERPYWVTPETFCQANPDTNRLLRRHLQGWVGEDPGPMVELYAGSGNFSRDLASLGPLISVEADPGAARLARRNLEGLPLEWLTQDAGQALDALALRGVEPALVVLDPPRTGAKEVIPKVLGLRPPRVIYVSCDPMTLARDLAMAVTAGYRLERVLGIDTLPQTSHFETLTELVRKTI